MKVYNANEQYKKYVNNEISASLSASNLEITKKGFKITLHETASNGDDIYFDLFVEAKDIEVTVTKDRAAYIIAVLVMQKYDYIEFDFDICRQTLVDIEKITKAEIKARNIIESVPTSNVVRNKFALCMSGGADSAALSKLCPDLIPITLKFTAVESNEETIAVDTAKALGSIEVLTNASEFLFPHFSWGYYNIGALLLADTLNISVSTNGKILGDTAMSWARGHIACPEIDGLSLVYPLAGLSKAGVFKLLYKLDPEFYNTLTAKWFDYLEDGEFIKKSARVRLLIDAVVTGKMRDVNTKLPRLSADANIFYTAYFINKLGVDVVEKYFNNTENVIEMLNGFSTDFLEKYDQRELEKLPAEFREYLEKQFESAGIEYYTEKDYEDRQNLVSLMGY